MKCKNPNCENETDGRAQTCSGKCRVALHRSVTNGSITESVTRTIVDAVGKAHPVDFESRRKNHATLLAWAKGTIAQQVLGRLSLAYNSRIDLNHYLGLTE